MSRQRVGGEIRWVVRLAVGDSETLTWPTTAPDQAPLLIRWELLNKGPYTHDFQDPAVSATNGTLPIDKSEVRYWPSLKVHNAQGGEAVVYVKASLDL